MNKSIWWIALIAIFAVLVMATACGGDDDAQTPRAGTTTTTTAAGATGTVEVKFEGTKKIGMIIDLQGPLAIGTLKAAQPGLEAAVRDINAGGGIVIGGKHYKLAVDVVDARSDKVAAVAAAQEMLGDKEMFAVAPVTLNFPAVYEQLKGQNLLIFTHDSGATNLLASEGGAAHPILFGSVTDITTTIGGWVSFIKASLPEVKSLAMLLPDSGAVKPIPPAFEASATKAGMQYKGTELYPPATTDLSTFITRLKGQKPDLVNIATSVAQLKQYIDLDLAPYIITSFAPKDLSQIRLGGTTAVFLGTREPYSLGIAPPELIPVLKEKFGDFPELLGLGMAYYDTTYLIKQAAEAANSLENKAIAAKLVGQKFKGPFGTATMQENHTVLAPGALIAASDKSYTIYTFESQVATKVTSKYEIAR